jgi:hypothetical protein
VRNVRRDLEAQRANLGTPGAAAPDQNSPELTNVAACSVRGFVQLLERRLQQAPALHDADAAAEVERFS